MDRVGKAPLCEHCGRRVVDDRNIVEGANVMLQIHKNGDLNVIAVGYADCLKKADQN